MKGKRRLLREITILHIKSQKKLIRKRIKLNINANMEREKVDVPPVLELELANMEIRRGAVAPVVKMEFANTTNGSHSVATVSGLLSVNMESGNNAVATAAGLSSAKIARTGLTLTQEGRSMMACAIAATRANFPMTRRFAQKKQ